MLWLELLADDTEVILEDEFTASEDTLALDGVNAAEEELIPVTSLDCVLELEVVGLSSPPQAVNAAIAKNNKECFFMALFSPYSCELLGYGRL